MIAIRMSREFTTAEQAHGYCPSQEQTGTRRGNAQKTQRRHPDGGEHECLTTAKAPHLEDKSNVPLRIGIVTEYYYPLLGGISENVHHTAAELVARGHDVTIITSAPAINGSQLPHPNGIPLRRVGRSMTVTGNGAIAHFALGGAGMW